VAQSVGSWAYRENVIIRDWVAAAWARLRHPRRPGIQRLPFDAVEFVIVDVETTGWSPREHRITEIGAVRLRGGQVQGEFTALVNPGQPIPDDIVALTGISNEMAAAAPPLCTVLPSFLEFARGGVLTAHNAPFDIAFLAAACAGCGLSWPGGPVLDTVAVARHVLADGEVPNCKLATLADFFGAQVRPRHRALADAQATAAVLTSLLGRLTAGGTATLAQFRRAQAKRRRAERRRGGGPPGPDRSGPGSRLPDTALPENALPGTAGPARAVPCAAEAGGGPVPGARLAR
jgi:DNA polymerase-3 subunit epsilon